MNSVSVGVLVDHEVELLIDLAKVIWMSCYRGMISDAQIEYMLEQRYRPGVLRQQIESGNPIFVARVEETIIGFAHLFIDDHQARLDKLYVDPELQRHGIGGLLVDVVRREALAVQCSLLTLRVNRQNHNALKAYQKYGFEVVATHCEDIGGGFFMDDFILLMDLC